MLCQTKGSAGKATARFLAKISVEDDTTSIIYIKTADTGHMVF